MGQREIVAFLASFGSETSMRLAASSDCTLRGSELRGRMPDIGTFEPFETKRLQTGHREPGIRSATVEPRGAARLLSVLNPLIRRFLRLAHGASALRSVCASAILGKFEGRRKALERRREQGMGVGGPVS
jgi:hypothetical protein